MKRFTVAIVICCLAVCASPGYAFVDYLFGGSSNTGAIDNSAIGDLRAWWTGNPAYQFNPYYSGSANPATQSNQPGGQQPAAAQAPQPNVSFYPPGGQVPQAQQYGQAPQAAYGAPPQQYGPPQQGYQPAPQGYQAPQGYGAPAGYQPPQQAYQAPPQYQAPQQGYGPPAGYQPQQQAYQGPPQQQFYNGENGVYGGAGFVPGQPMR